MHVRESFAERVEVEMVDLRNPQRVKDVYKGWRKKIIEKRKRSMNQMRINQGRE